MQGQEEKCPEGVHVGEKRRACGVKGPHKKHEATAPNGSKITWEGAVGVTTYSTGPVIESKEGGIVARMGRQS